MTNIQWILGVEPSKLAVEWRQGVQALFLNETGETYADVSVSSLPIPAWDGNMLLVDMNLYPKPQSLKGLLWSLPFLDTGVRIAAFAIHSDQQGQGWGSQAWNHLMAACRGGGKSFIQLEVKASNTRAQEFYRKRGLEVENHLENYYQSGLGYMMKGPVPRNSNESDEQQKVKG